jgi:hypothetical protein
MADTHVATYVNDHLAGSVAALELLGQLEKAHASTSVGQVVAALRADIEEDRQELETLRGRLKVSASLPRRAMAWLAEKAAEVKLKIDDPSGGAFHLMETMEALVLGIEGKAALWRALAIASEHNPRLRGPDYAHLERRASEQQQRAEKVRLDAAREALAAS